MNCDDLLKELKFQLVQGIDPENQDDLSRINIAYSAFETKINWVKEHMPDEVEGKSVREVVDLYNRYSPIFKQVKNESVEQQRSSLDEEIRVKARAFYGIGDPSPASALSLGGDKSSLKISEVAKLYSDEMCAGKNWTEKTLQENLAAYKLFIGLQGDVFIDEVEIKDITNFKSQLQKVPTNFKKNPSTRDNSILSVVGSEHGLATLSVSSVNKYLSKISALLGWARKNGYCKENVGTGLKIKQRKNAQDDRYPFTHGELLQIFSNEIYTQNKKHKHTYYFWLPLLGLFTGARIDELCQLSVSDIKGVDQNHYIDFNDLDDKKLKTDACRRDVPIHSKLIEIGFLDFVESVKISGSEKVFPTIKKGRDGYGQAPSKWFSRLKSKLDLVEPEKKAFHSFRHNFPDALKALNVPEYVASQLTGHRNDSLTYGVYGSALPLKNLKEIVEKVDFDIPTLKNLKYVHSGSSLRDVVASVGPAKGKKK